MIRMGFFRDRFLGDSSYQCSHLNIFEKDEEGCLTLIEGLTLVLVIKPR